MSTTIWHCHVVLRYHSRFSRDCGGGVLLGWWSRDEGGDDGGGDDGGRGGGHGDGGAYGNDGGGGNGDNRGYWGGRVVMGIW
ncbi:heterogeneous nuclear ribonucleoprotein A2 1-like [Pyrus ussuriensis x Pyrus communis]|uniref:Heterogeneous nuclear ribonucleoprotein A2 1-like n=1 Tax=Pyrus ussuriensis x Pyrus communis TaxID=2448454 RepID=A0A5N5G2D4_9ROSA|nr:heterogeneous nuclear ribonucleoprotein A2 1-like [Pyrus ussuriensis x Pyrus communis]